MGALLANLGQHVLAEEEWKGLQTKKNVQFLFEHDLSLCGGCVSTNSQYISSLKQKP